MLFIKLNLDENTHVKKILSFIFSAFDDVTDV